MRKEGRGGAARRLRRLAACTLLLFALTGAARAERVQEQIELDPHKTPWCAHVVWDIDMEAPDEPPAGIPQAQTRYATLPLGPIRRAMAAYAEEPVERRWLNGRDDLNRMNYLYWSKEGGTYRDVYLFPAGVRLPYPNHPMQETLDEASDVLRAFLTEAGIEFEYPFYRVGRDGDGLYTSLTGLCEQDDSLRTIPLVKDATGIAFRFTLGGLPVAEQGIYDPQVEGRRDVYYERYGQATVTDAGRIRSLRLSNAHEVVRMLEPDTAPVIPWREAVMTAVRAEAADPRTIDGPEGGGTASAWAEVERERVAGAELCIAISPTGRTFPVWGVVLEADYVGGYAYSGTRYVDAHTGAACEAGEDWTP
ncbi:hypothetical protein [Beduinella massiliensis]|uniref:hypothetical protein n=1 Tax=Beduinella massiliensis TaxID=1852363 RepID=UPI000C856352